MAKLSINDFSGGLRTDVAQNLIADNESPAMQNVWNQYTGTLTKRKGIVVWGHASSPSGYNPVVKLYTGIIDGTNYYNFLLVNAHAQSAVTQRLARMNTNFGANPSTATLGNVSFPGTTVKFYNGLYYVNADNLYSFSGAAGSKTTVNTLKGYNLEILKNIFFFGGVNDGTTRPSRVRWSALGDPTQWPTNNFVDVNTGDGTFINGLKVFKDSLIIFKGPRQFDQSTSTQANAYAASSIWMLSGEPGGFQNGIYTLQKLDTSGDWGVVYPDSITVFNNSLFFLTNKGYFMYDGNSFTNVSEKIRDTVESWNKYRLGSGITNIDAIEVFAFPYKNNLYVTLADGQTNFNNALYVLNTSGEWWKWTTPLPVDGLAIDNAENLIFGTPVSSGSGQIAGGIIGNTTIGPLRTTNRGPYYDTATTDIEGSEANHLAIDSFYTTKEFDFKSPLHFKYLTVDFRGQKSGVLGVEYNIDQKGWVKRTVDMSSSVNDIRRSQRILIGLQGRTIQIRLSNNQTYTNFEVYSVDVEYTPLHDTGEINTAKAINTVSNS